MSQTYMQKIFNGYMYDVYYILHLAFFEGISVYDSFKQLNIRRVYDFELCKFKIKKNIIHLSIIRCFFKITLLSPVFLKNASTKSDFHMLLSNCTVWVFGYVNFSIIINKMMLDGSEESEEKVSFSDGGCHRTVKRNYSYEQRSVDWRRRPLKGITPVIYS